jgi:exodeoxyribonuclease V
MTASEISKLTPKADQAKALEKAKKWFNSKIRVGSKKPFLVLSGYAGTGKSTLLRWIQNELNLQNHEITFSSFTGKATNVLVQNGLNAKTLHRLLYKSYFNKRTGTYYSQIKKEGLSEKLIVVDEASMLSEKLFDDLMKITGDFKILFVGDDAQLPPINSDFNIMKNPDIRLKKILRQAALNPIIRLSMQIRNGEDWKIENVINDGIGYSRITDEVVEAAADRAFRNDVFLCSMNRDRVLFNKEIRSRVHKGKKSAIGTVTKNDRLIILDNCAKQEVFNGQMFTVSKHKKDGKHKIVFHGSEEGIDSNEDCKISIHPYSFLQESSVNRFELCKELRISFKTMGVSCDYAYCLTVHKSQGSQFDNVYLKLSNSDKRIWGDLYSRWLYTAVTRASKNLYFLE